MDKFEKVKSTRERWEKYDAHDAHDTHYVYWHDYITLDMVDFMISEIERLTEELEMSESILEYMTSGQDADGVLNI